MRFTPRSFAWSRSPYASVTTSVFLTLSSSLTSVVTEDKKPSSFNFLAIASRCPEYGADTSRLPIIAAFCKRIIKSPTRSVTIKLPRCLLNARYLPLSGEFSELDAREAEGAHIAARTACYRTAVLEAHRRRVSRERLQTFRVTGQLQSRTLHRVLLDEFLLLSKSRELGFLGHE